MENLNKLNVANDETVSVGIVKYSDRWGSQVEEVEDRWLLCIFDKILQVSLSLDCTQSCSVH